MQRSGYSGQQNKSHANQVMASPSIPAEVTNNAFNRHQHAPNTQNQAPHHQQHPQPLPNQFHQEDQAIIGGGIRVINQHPNNANLIFPISYNKKSVNIVSIITIIVGFLQNIVGIVNIATVPYYTSYLAFPIWCGILISITGIIGILSTKTQSKCLIGAFLALSICSFLVSMGMLGLRIGTIAYFTDDDYFSKFVCDNYYHCHYEYFFPSYRNLAIGMSSFLLVLIVLEMCLSLSAIVFSCKAYCKCCNTCHCSDAKSCVGCCECDTLPNNYQIFTNETHTPSNVHACRARTMASTDAPPVITTRNVQQPIPSQPQLTQNSSPYQAVTNINICFPGSCRVFNVAKIPQNDPGSHSIQVTFDDDGSAQTASMVMDEARGFTPQNTTEAHQVAGAGAGGYTQPPQLPPVTQHPPPAYSLMYNR